MAKMEKVARNTKSQRFSVLTYNVNFGLVRSKNRVSNYAVNVVKAIKESKAEIVLLQETNEAWEEYLMSSGFDEIYPNRKFIHIGAAGGLAVLTKYEIVSCELIDTRQMMEESWFPHMYCKISINEEFPNIHVVNCHLRPPKGWMFWTRHIRREEVQHCLTHVSKFNPNSEPILFLGDFNEDDGWNACQLLKQEEFYDALEQIPKNRETHRYDLFTIFGWTYVLKSRLDHIFFKPNNSRILELLSVDILKGYETNASDHQPVFAEFIQYVDKK